MAEDKELKFLIYVVSGIAVISFIYLIYKDWSNEHRNTQYMSSVSPINNFSNNSVSNEVIYSLLGNQQNIVQNQQYQLENIDTKLKSAEERLNMLDNKLQSNKEQIDYISNTKPKQPIENVSISNLEPSAKDPISQKSNIGDKIRKLRFNMI